MSNIDRARYLNLLADVMVATFGLTKAIAKAEIKSSQMNELLTDRPEFVDHVPLEAQAKEIHNGSNISSATQVANKNRPPGNYARRPSFQGAEQNLPQSGGLYSESYVLCMKI